MRGLAVKFEDYATSRSAEERDGQSYRRPEVSERRSAARYRPASRHNGGVLIARTGDEIGSVNQVVDACWRASHGAPSFLQMCSRISPGSRELCQYRVLRSQDGADMFLLNLPPSRRVRERPGAQRPGITRAATTAAPALRFYSYFTRHQLQREVLLC